MVLSNVGDTEWPWLERELGCDWLAVSRELQECRHKLNQANPVQLGLRLCHTAGEEGGMQGFTVNGRVRVDTEH